MKDALRVEAAKAGPSIITSSVGSRPGQSSTTGVVLMDISNINVEKLTPDERESCILVQVQPQEHLYPCLPQEARSSDQSATPFSGPRPKVPRFRHLSAVRRPLY